MKRTASILISLATLFLVSPTSFAQNQYRFEFFASVNVPKDETFEIEGPQSQIPIQGEHKWSPGARGGVRVGVDFAKYWGQDFSYSVGSQATRITSQALGTDFPFTVRTHQVEYNGLWYPIGYDNENRVFSPYLTAGVGALFLDLSCETEDRTFYLNQSTGVHLRGETTFAFNTGGGARFRYSKHVGVRLDARDYMSRGPRFGLPLESEDPDETVFPTCGIFHQFQFSFSFIYFF